MNRRTARRRYSLALELYHLAAADAMAATTSLQLAAAHSRMERHLTTIERIEAAFTR